MMSNHYTILIVDDEPLARENVRLLVEKDPEIMTIVECANAREARQKLEFGSFDIMFLDIQMPGMTGFELLESSADLVLPVVIFVTAFDRYALRAFEASAVDYLLKPFDDARFYAALQRAKGNVRHKQAYNLAETLMAFLEANPLHYVETKPPSSQPYLQRLTLKSHGKMLFLNVQDIVWIEAEDYYMQIHTNDGKTHLLRETMNHLEQQLDPTIFLRIHRSAIVHKDAVSELRTQTHGDGLIILHNGTTHKISRSRKQQIQLILQQK